MKHEWPPEVQKVLDKVGLTPSAEGLIETLADLLGESPEAWRGAEATADVFLSLDRAALDHGDGWVTVEARHELIMSLLVAVSLHPLANGLNERRRQGRDRTQ